MLLAVGQEIACGYHGREEEAQEEIEQEKKREEAAGKEGYLPDFLQGKTVWALEDGGNTCIAANDKENEIAVGSSAGHVTMYNTSDWSTKCVLTPPTGNKVLALQYGCIRSKLDQKFLLVGMFVRLYVCM